ITKGAIGIMKADGGKYPLVALSDERRKHSEFQFDAKAVIVPLISSTGHGHASMKRVHYQEGKFALGNILCAVIPNDETQLNAKYLHLYLQQFKETLLVPLMKGAANVSLPMNKLADIVIEVPSLKRQLDIIALEEEAAEYKNELEERLISQDADIKKLRQAILRDALQGLLVKQNLIDENANDLLKKIKAEKEKLNADKKIKKELSPISEEEIPFVIPENWVWCRLGDIVELQMGQSPEGNTYNKKGNGIPFYQGKTEFGVMYPVGVSVWCNQPKKISEANDILISVRAPVGDVNIADKKYAIGRGLSIIRVMNKTINHVLLFYFLDYIKRNWKAKGSFFEAINRDIIEARLFPLPPLPEQNRIVKKIEQLMQLCDDLQYSIQQSKIENEKLLRGALRDAIKKEEMAV
ncbi:MAG: restriction endonuclease subunit S, partial [Paludibacter sp.]|nr:restriction endonuclease subunit S [Paludibacter sp.]